MAAKITKEESIQTQDESRRARRTKEERRADIMDKIAYHEAKIGIARTQFDTKAQHHQGLIDRLKEKMEALDAPRAPRTRKPGYGSIAAMAKEAGITPDELLEFIQRKQS